METHKHVDAAPATGGFQTTADANTGAHQDSMVETGTRPWGEGALCVRMYVRVMLVLVH